MNMWVWVAKVGQVMSQLQSEGLAFNSSLGFGAIDLKVQWSWQFA